VLSAAIVSPLAARDDWSDLQPEPETYYGSEKARKVPVDAIFWVMEDWEGHYSNQLFWLYKHKDYPRFKSTRFFPFYYSLDSKIDERNSFFAMPVPGLFYHRRYDSDETRINSTFWISRVDRRTSKIWDLYFFLFYSSEEGPDNDRDYDHAFFPLYYGGSNPARGQSYSTLFPLYYYESQSSANRDYFSFIFPLLFYESSARPNAEDSFHFSPLHYRSYETNSSSGNTSYSSRTGFPILPILYANRETENSSSTNLLTVFHYSEDESGWSAISPLYLWEKRPNYSVRWLPFYFHDTRDDGYFHIPPLWFSDSEPEGDTNFSLLHYYSEDQDSSIFGFPLIPIVYASKSEPGYSRHNLLTVFYWDSSADSSTTFLPPYYHSRERIQSRDMQARAASYKSEELPPFRSVNNPRGNPVVGSNAPPAEFEDHYNIALLMDWKTRGDSMERFWFAPLYFQGYGEDPYTYLVPLYFQTSGPDHFNSWGLLHYYDRTAETKSILFPLLPVLYAYRTDGSTRKTNYLTIFYTRDSEDGYLRFLPPYYHSHDIVTEATGVVRKDHFNIALLANWNETNDELNDFFFAPLFFWKEGENGYTHVVPLYFEDRNPERELNFGPAHFFRKDETTEYLWVLPYYSWINKEESGSSGNVMVPLYFNYEDPVKNYHVNLGGISLSEESLNVRVNTVTGETKAVSVLDTDVGWFYNLFSYSARIPLQETDDTRVLAPERREEIPEGSQILSVETFDPDDLGTDNQPETLETEEGVAIKKDTSINRDNSIRFSGWSVLFGLFARETADTRHHARALPLFWLSWDDASADQVTVIPGAYMSYDEAPNHYFVLFPLFLPIYASQETPDYSLHSYGLFLYLDEEDRVAERTETSIVWPFYNSYDSPAESGSRLLPVYYSKRQKDPDGKGYSEFSLTPLSYSTEEKSYGPGSSEPMQERSGFYSPLYLSGEVRSPASHSSWSFFPVPFYYSGVENNRKTQNLLILGHRESTIQDDQSTETDHLRLFPLFFYGRDYHAVFPLYYYESDGEDSSFISPVYWSESSGGVSENRLFWLISWTGGEEAESDINILPLFFYAEDEHLVLFPLYFGFGPSESRSHWGPIYYYEEGPSSLDMLIGPVYYSSWDHKEGIDSSFHLFPLVFNWWEGDSYTGFYGIFYRHSSPDYARQYIPLIYENEWTRTDSGQSREVSFLFKSFYFESSPYGTNYGGLYRILFGYDSSGASSSSSANTSTSWNLNVLSFVLADGPGDSFHHSFLPLYWYESESDETSFHFIPLLTFNNWQGDGYYGLQGPVWVESDGADYSRYYTPILFESEWNKNQSGDSLGKTDFLLGSTYYERTPDGSETALLWRALGGYESYNYRDRWNANLLSFVMVDRDLGWHHSFLPLYWIDYEGNDRQVLIPPLLGWSYSDDGDVSEGLGLGLLWYRNEDPAKMEHTRTLLMGGLLYYDRYRGRQNNFREWGSVYGFLWDYELEPGAGYEKFSVLKFVFSRTRDRGKVTYKFIGLPLYSHND